MSSKPRRFSRRRRWPWIAALVFCVLAVWVGSHAGTTLVVSKDVIPPDAIVILGSHEFERFPPAIDLAHRFPSSTLILTVPRTPTRWNCQMCPERAALLASAGIPASRIVELPERVTNTYDEAVATRKFVSATAVKKLMVVTSPYHARRALHVFEHILASSGVEVGIHPATSASAADPQRWWLHQYDREYVLYEWAGLLAYRVKYGVPLH